MSQLSYKEQKAQSGSTQLKDKVHVPPPGRKNDIGQCIKKHITSACCVQLCYCTLLLLLLVQDVNNLEKIHMNQSKYTLY